MSKLVVSGVTGQLPYTNPTKIEFMGKDLELSISGTFKNGQPIAIFSFEDGLSFEGLLDTGSPRMIIDQKVATAKKLELLKADVDAAHVLYGDHKMNLYRAQCHIQGYPLDAEIHATKLHGHKVIVGMPFIKLFDELIIRPQIEVWMLVKRKKEGT